MRKLGTPVLCALICVVTLAVAGPLATAQRGGQSGSRVLGGHVFNGREEPVAKAIVYLKNTKTLTIKTYITDPDGTYHFPALAQNVDYEVYAEQNGARSDVKTLSAFDNRKLVSINLKIKER
ncbi:MAG TPA: carboxypeptidase-like regulatory domain-containing protein [Candidatus Angelobacter sp.]|nr:carboxypeptidase-like regulatory domain-containing protein [Candidatus Angelobacter sp.]